MQNYATAVCHVCLVDRTSSESCALTINENCDPSVRTDLMRAFEEIEFNATCMKRSVSVPVLKIAESRSGRRQGSIYLPI